VRIIGAWNFPFALTLINSGQICIAPDYVLADAKIRDELVSKIKDAVTKFESADPSGKRIVNQRHFDRLTASLAATKGDVAIGGGSDASKLTIQPTVVVDPDPAEPLMTDEIFGPILPVMTVQSLDDAINFVNSRPKPLAAYLSTKTKSVRERVVKEVPAGGMVITTCSSLRHQQVAVRRRRSVGHGRLPRQVRVRGVQPPQDGDDQANPTRRQRHDLSPVYREGLETR
jgi:acyl-CoA reductase-like NAD-dependent aldehyde dehydrogenase